MRSLITHRHGLALLALLLLAITAHVSGCQVPAKRSARATRELPPNHPRGRAHGTAFQRQHFQVAQGAAEVARKYYRETVSPQLQLLTPETIEASTIRELLTYFGYAGITAKDLHRLASGDLMSLGAPGEVLATRFFAPKISDVADQPRPIPEGGFGWRKLVRLKARSGSAAAGAGMESLWFLQNVFEKTAEGDPFDADRNVSKFNQAIVLRQEGPFGPLKQPIYFFTYGPLVRLDAQGRVAKDANGNLVDEGKLILSLQATFDEEDRDPETNLQPKEYFVPDSCVECHGRSRQRAKVNYLDTDHWFDRVTPQYGLSDPRFQQEDFTALAGSPHGVLYDGGKDRSTERFRAAIEVIRALNQEARAQNERVGGPDNFQLGAVNQWLKLHEPGSAGVEHVPPVRRGFGNQVWKADDEGERRILYYLNRYCYRCHSSVIYNVFDREAVLLRRDKIAGLVVNVESPKNWMPQDRIFPGLTVNPTTGAGEATGEVKEFLDLLGSLQP